MNIDRTATAIDGIRAGLRLLPALLAPGTPRRWNQHEMTPEQEARMDQLARAEREAKRLNMAMGLKSLGNAQAPLSLDVLDLLADLDASIADLEAAVCERLGLDVRASATTDQRLEDLGLLLGRVADDEDLAEHVEDEVHRMHRQVRRALGEHEPVHRLHGVRCPTCGALSIRGLLDSLAFVCVNAACRCDDETCACHAERPRRHRWAFSEWPELAGTIEARKTA
ncbi:hypothetical protein Ssi03_76350 [Sphaerisporangium siamense]|uniref:Uncharacterized protein n=1 Tax=Sphaerisporangium siamense TaxID=795645 RepID=A0A7W7D394_9ACTN|nr:hypothetical protein [Sphaerisporangium siamense]MBB4699316.1 hypothetical protein [Sphaerisporangium siamense]GII89645.1 hypothetical protein Ssi03_76350 [Sphaerisporangium siamense]